jgi:hypothetical protein
MTNQIQKDIKPRGIASAYIEASFDKGKEVLAKKGYKIISLQENARLRMQEGKDAYISQNGNWTKEAFLYIPKKGKFLTKNSPIMANAKEATDCHRSGRDFYLNDSQVEESLSDSVVLSATSVPTNRFGENKITVYAFGDDAKKYGEFLREAGINEMPVWTSDLQDNSYVRQMWLCRLGGVRSGLDGWDLGYGRVRGVKVGAEGVAQNSYTQEQISKALSSLGFSGLEKGLVSKLRE